MIQVTLFTKADCGLCDEAAAALHELQADIPHHLVEVDIEADPDLLKRYFDIIPVVKAGPFTIQAPIDPARLQVTLAAARDGWETSERRSNTPRNRGVTLNKAVLFFARHWLAIFNLIVFLFVGLPFAAPVLLERGATRPARLIYSLYSPVCHQLSFRSWFLFGEQMAYPLEQAGTSLNSFGEMTGIEGDDFQSAREHIGDARIGYKVALCQRDVGIYAGILLAGLVFALVRSRLKPLPIVLWLLLGVLPLALDGGSQLLSSLPLIDFPVRESTPFLRTLTGALFGVMNAWMAYPYIEESMKETRILIATKLSMASVPLKTS